MKTNKERRKKRIVVFVGGVFLLIIFGLGLYGILVEPYRIEIRHVWIEDSGLGKILEGETVVHLSDLHISQIGKKAQKVLSILDEVQPDIIFLTGDYVSWQGDVEPSLEFLSNLKAKIGIWAVMGDYDYSYSRKSCLFCHEQGSGNPTKRHQVQFLRNTLEKIDLPNGSLWIGGIDLEGGKLTSLNRKTPIWKGKEPAIILSHNPLNFEQLDEKHNVLMLSGDTHGGQVLLPSWVWGILGYEKNARYNQGLYEKGRKKMFVSRGIGTSHVPVRIGRRPEVVVLHFRGRGP